MSKSIVSLCSRLLAVLAIAFSLARCPSAVAQVDTGTVLGSVIDSTGAVIPDANVTLTNQAQGTSLTTKTNREGNYQFPVVRAGVYSIAVEATGFTHSKRENVSVSIQQRAVFEQGRFPERVTTCRSQQT